MKGPGLCVVLVFEGFSSILGFRLLPWQVVMQLTLV